MALNLTDRATEIAESLRNKVTDALPMNNPQVSKLFACVAPAEEEEFADDDDSMYSGGSNNQENNTANKANTFSAMNEQMRSVVSTTFNKKFRCNGEDDADTKLTENDNGSSYYDGYSMTSKTVGLNTVDGRNDVSGSNILGSNKNTTNSRTYNQSFKDRYVQMKKNQQFAVIKSSDKPSLSINAGQAMKDYDAAKTEKQRRAQLAQEKAQEILENAALRTGDPRSPSNAVRTPIDP
ncbi:MAG: hypothetical protein SGBAC_002503 [Bacillariaceae sp.]